MDREKGIRMPKMTIVYWRDVPAQVIVGKGRGAAKIELSDRFEQAIGRCAMKIGAKGDDDYIGEWRKVSLGEVSGDPSEAAHAMAEKLESEYDRARFKALIANAGWAGEAAGTQD